ncbi:hypothetical protein ACFQZC_06010 [Streptacidiphilus monticola]
MSETHLPAVPLRVAVAQACPVPGDVAANAAAAAAMVREAGDAGRASCSSRRSS